MMTGQKCTACGLTATLDSTCCRSRIAALEARVRERTESLESALASRSQVESDLAAARATIGELVGALTPFAVKFQLYADNCQPLDDEQAGVVSVGDLRRAAALVARHQQ